MGRRHTIGLGHLSAICRMDEKERLAFLDEGLHVILASAEGFWTAAEALGDQPREADVLDGFAREEAAKILILLDLHRCPKAHKAERIGTFVRWYYDHLARLLYAAAVGWRPVTKGELRSYIDRERRSHVVDGPVGEWIMPAGPVVERERRLYADVERFDDHNLLWNVPRSWRERLQWAHIRRPDILNLAVAMRNLGFFTAEGLRIMSDVWGGQSLNDDLTRCDANDLKIRTLQAVEAAGALPAEATDEDVQTLCQIWPFPMWDFNLRGIDVPMDELEAERERNLWNEAGY